MTPEEARELFSEAFDGELDPARKAAFDAALQDDAALAAEYEAFATLLRTARSAGSRQRGALARGSTPDLLPGVQARLRARSRGRFYADRFAERLGSGLLQPLPLALLMLGLLALAWLAVSWFGAASVSPAP